MQDYHMESIYVKVPQVVQLKTIQTDFLMQYLRSYLKKLYYLSYQPDALRNPEIVSFLSYLQDLQSYPTNENPSKVLARQATVAPRFVKSDSVESVPSAATTISSKLALDSINKLQAKREPANTPKETAGITEVKCEEEEEERSDVGTADSQLQTTPQATDNLIKQQKVSLSKKISKKVNTCGHPDREHYAKGMCNNCYHKNGRNKKPWYCKHDKLYAHGLCQRCYIIKYNAKKATENQAILEQLDLPFFNQFKQKMAEENAGENNKVEGELK